MAGRVLSYAQQLLHRVSNVDIKSVVGKGCTVLLGAVHIRLTMAFRVLNTVFKNHKNYACSTKITFQVFQLDQLVVCICRDIVASEVPSCSPRILQQVSAECPGITVHSQQKATLPSVSWSRQESNDADLALLAVRA